MANLLTKLQLSELSLVDRPANPDAMVSLYKRDNGVIMDKDILKTLENLAKNADEKISASVTQILEKLDEADRLRDEVARLTKALTEDGYVITTEAVEKREPEEAIEVEGETVLKKDIPAAILKKMEADAAALEEAEVAKREAEVIEKVAEIAPHIDIDNARILVKMAEEQGEEFANFVKSVDKLFEATMEEIGKKHELEDFSKAEDALDSLVKKHMADNNMAKVDYAKAYAAVVSTDEGKALVLKTYKGE